jgi:hypothetical protein
MIESTYSTAHVLIDRGQSVVRYYGVDERNSRHVTSEFGIGDWSFILASLRYALPGGRCENYCLGCFYF